MFKKVLTGLTVGGALLGMVGMASAADININIYGASAQYKFWNAAADDFLRGKGCLNVTQASDGSKHGITKGDCGSDTVYIRYSSKASVDGIYSVSGIDPLDATDCDDTFNAGYREMASTNGITWGNPDAGVVNYECVDVTIGASDVAAGTFKQQSSGMLWGHFAVDPANGTTPNYSVNQVVNNVSDAGLNFYRPVIVPFAFFAHDDVPFDNLSRVMAANLFAGNVGDWSDFNPALPSQEVKVCLRHAGSGTHATLDAAVMRGELPLANAQPLSFLNNYPEIWFYDGSSDLLDALQDLPGSVGYLDADKNGTLGNEKKANVKRLTYNGIEPYRASIVNGTYSFWSAQWLYENPADPSYATTHSWVQDLDTFASTPANIAIVGKDGFWAAQGEMQVVKATDFSLPAH